MSSNLQKNNTALEGILNTINDLPNANSGSSEAVLYVAQELTDEQKEQARANIDALAESDVDEIVDLVLVAMGGQPVFGYVDGSNNIIITAPLADGTYTAKYEMGDGSTIEIGDLVLGGVVRYSLTKNLTNCTIVSAEAQNATTVIKGSDFYAMVRVNDGYTFSSFEITMGGVDITSSAFLPEAVDYLREISILDVTGDIVITATATASVGSYSITTNFTNCYFEGTTHTSNIASGETFSASIAENSGYELKTITVTMGGTNITSSVVNGKDINIANVTGNIVITAVAEASGPAYINQIPISINSDGSLFVGTNGEKGYKTNTRISLSSGSETSQSGVEVTGFIPIKEGDTVYIKGITISESATTQTLAFYNSNFELTKTGGASQSGVYTGAVFGAVNGEIKSLVFNYTNIQNNNFNGDVAYMRLSAGEINADSILTINQPIT